MLCRTWWAIYILDRRLALESGRPFLIQDANIDTSLPLPVSDEWLSRAMDHADTMFQMQHDVGLAKELDRLPFSMLLYVECLVRFYRIVGKVWPALYGRSNNGPSAIVEYADASLSKLMREVPPGLKYKPDVPWEEQATGRPRWQMKQALLFFMVRWFLFCFVTDFKVYELYISWWLTANFLTVLHISSSFDKTAQCRRTVGQADRRRRARIHDNARPACWRHTRRA